MITEYRAISDLKSNPTSSPFLHMVSKHLQHLHCPHKLHPCLQFHCGTGTGTGTGPGRDREGSDVEGGGHVLSPTGGDLSGGDVDEPDGAGGGGEKL